MIMNKNNKNKNYKKIIPVIIAVAVFVIAAFWQSSKAYAAQPQNFDNRHMTVSGNANYQFTSGGDHRHDLGRPTGFDGFVPADVFSVNTRRDANVSLRPVDYGIFSGYIPTAPVSRLFPQPVNPHFSGAVLQDNPNLIPRLDTLSQGINAPPADGFLPHTSIR